MCACPTDHITINLFLHHQLALSSRHKRLEHLFKVLGHLLECPLDRLILALIERVDELFDAVGRVVELVSSRQVLVALLCEGLVLVKRLLVDMLVLFEGTADVVQFFQDLPCQLYCLRKALQS